MKRFFCRCGQEIFFNNLFCESCGRDLAYDPLIQSMWSGELSEQGFLPHYQDGSNTNVVLKPCDNRHYPINCNWLVTDEAACQCISCQTTRTIPDMNVPKNPQRWRILERAKRHLFSTLLLLNLPIQNYRQVVNGLSFDFLEDKRTNPNVALEHVLTGHSHGQITLNAAEADEGFLHTMKEEMGEPYRTVLGHFRHEIGHYYWDKLINNQQRLEAFRELFGDERQDYDEALKRYYENGAPEFRSHQYISMYASSHPFEDWAETWAHYMHIVDTLETAVSYGLSVYKPKVNDFNSWYSEWARVAQVMNALSRSMGHDDAYPFVLTDIVKGKLKFIDKVVDSFSEQGAEVLN
ncbi:zinc-binding metallopeptidase family protein [Hydrogenovibrio kuenenii]|uniref:zinc-binding metallopeptidase family protein n=1 Tax=Hydrogenovibrio kuenenii TaxID=63658 RepID=UPI00046595E8|nr:putative zinc-binding metallopeptidase [Hydrogenovibrio kuenenii]